MTALSKSATLVIIRCLYPVRLVPPVDCDDSATTETIMLGIEEKFAGRTRVLRSHGGGDQPVQKSHGSRTLGKMIYAEAARGKEAQ